MRIFMYVRKCWLWSINTVGRALLVFETEYIYILAYGRKITNKWLILHFEDWVKSTLCKDSLHITVGHTGLGLFYIWKGNTDSNVILLF